MDAQPSIKSPDNTAVGVGGLDVPPSRRWIKVSPLNKRRWESFKANRRGYWSLWVFQRRWPSRTAPVTWRW